MYNHDELRELGSYLTFHTDDGAGNRGQFLHPAFNHNIQDLTLIFLIFGVAVFLLGYLVGNYGLRRD